MSYPYDRISPFDVTQKRPLDLNEYHSNYSSPVIIDYNEYHSNYSNSANFKRPKYNENHDFSRSNDTLFPQNYQSQTWENSNHGPPFPRTSPTHDFSRDFVSIPSQFQYPNRDLLGEHEFSSQLYDPRPDFSARYDDSFDGWRRSKTHSHGFKARRNKSWKKGPIGKNPTRDFSRSDFGSSRARSSIGGPNSKTIPTGHMSRKYDSISPSCRRRSNENPKGFIEKLKPTQNFLRKSDSKVDIKSSESSKEALVEKNSLNNPHEAKPSKVLVTGGMKLKPNKSTVARDNFKIRKVNASCQFPKQSGTLAPPITKGSSTKRDLLKSYSTASVLEKVDDVEKVVKELKADYNLESIEPRLNDNIEGNVLKAVNDIEGVDKLKADAIDEVLKEANLPNDNEKLEEELILWNDMDKVCTNPIPIKNPKKFPPRRKGFSAIRDWPLKFITQKDQVFGPKNDDVVPVVEQSQSGAGVEPNLKENALKECPKLSADKPLECEEERGENQMQNSSIGTLDIQLIPIEKHRKKECAKDDVDTIEASYVSNSDLMPNQEKIKYSTFLLEDLKTISNGKRVKEVFDIQSLPTNDVDMIDDSYVSNSDLTPNQEKIESSTFLLEDTNAENHEHFNDLRIVYFEDHEPISNEKRVKDVLDSYNQVLEKLSKDNKLAMLSGKEKVSKQVYIEAAMLLKMEKQWVNTEPILGHVPGIEVGDRFRFRAELVCIGLHRNFQNGIDYIKQKDGKTLASSIVYSGRYENDQEFPDILRYCGQGGNPKTGLEDQKLVRGNLALKNSMEAKTPVRVIRKENNNIFQYYYDGLYIVTKVTQERSRYGNLVYMFELNRMISSESNGTHVKKLQLLVEDISLGKEKIPINVVNTVDDEKIPSFNYITHMTYPNYCYCEINGCDCTDGCSDVKKCRCLIKNGGEVFNENGSIILGPKSRRFIYECGSSCKCPPSCKNRVSQYGICHKLEIFKTKSMGWGVRSRNYIPAGSFICEYVGELLLDQEAEERSNNDEYLFEIVNFGYTIDAAKYGNVGRFINHSCSPNLYAQNVLFDHDNKKMPHVMFFAVNGIFPFQELTYDYNYKVDSVRDGDGNVKKKACHCGSRCCRGRLY